MMVYHNLLIMYYFFFKQQRAYEMRISDWSSDVCSSDLNQHGHGDGGIDDAGAAEQGDQQVGRQRRGQDVDQVVAQQDGAEQQVTAFQQAPHTSGALLALALEMVDVRRDRKMVV